MYILKEHLRNMRKECEFNGCNCHCYIKGAVCGRCGHGHVWHKRVCQFVSTRHAARTPQYERIPVVVSHPPVPPLPYCKTVIALPV